jgi:hypothetical protein
LDGGEIRVCGVSDLDAKPITCLDVVVQVDAVGLRIITPHPGINAALAGSGQERP